LVGCRGVFIDVRVQRQDADAFQAVALADRIVVEVVGGRDLDYARTKFAIDVVVRNDGDLAAYQRKRDGAPDQVGVTLVFRVHNARHIAQLGIGTGRGNYQHAQPAFRSGPRAPDLPHVAVIFLADDFQIGIGRAQYGIPVHQAAAPVNESLFIQADEHFGHAARQASVHGEVFHVPIAGGAQATELLRDGAAGLLLPLPDLL